MSNKNVEPVFRSVSLERLKKLKRQTSRIEYADTIRSGLHGREVDLVKRRLLLTDVPTHESEISRQDEFLDLLSRNYLEKAKDSLARKQEFVDFCKSKRDVAKQEYLKAKAEYEKAEKKLNEAEDAVATAELDAMYLQMEREQLERTFVEESQKRANMNEIVLLHRSANIGQIIDHINGKVIMTEADAAYLKYIFVPDYVFDHTLARGLIEKLPYKIAMIDDDNELKSIIQFVEMAMYFYLIGDEKVVMLYANQDISTVLKKEGI